MVHLRQPFETRYAFSEVLDEIIRAMEQFGNMESVLGLPQTYPVVHLEESFVDLQPFVDIFFNPERCATVCLQFFPANRLQFINLYLNSDAPGSWNLPISTRIFCW